MHRIRRAVPTLAVTAACMALGACCTSVNELQVSLNVRSNAGSFPPNYFLVPGFLTVGDTATVVAEAECRDVLAFGRQYGSTSHPDWFSFASSDAAVAVVDGHGTVSAHGPGSARITIRTQRVVDSLQLVISPVIASLHLSAAPALVHPGDTVQVLVTASDTTAALVDSAHVDVFLVPPTDSLAAWAGFIPPAFTRYALATPVALRLVAKRTGRLLITATTTNRPGPHHVAGDTASVDVQP